MANPSKSQKLQILHEHYQESFADLRERERIRDKLFLQVVGVVGVLLLMVQNPNTATEVFRTFDVQATINLNILPYHIILSIFWTLLLVLVVRFYQTSNTIEKSYNYLHYLENAISSYFEENFLYKREGEFYDNDASKFRNFIWIFYSKIIPIMIFVSSVIAVLFEWGAYKNNTFYSIYDTSIVIIILTVVILWFFRKEQKL
jgi:uncharacterized membrane protein